MCSALRSLAALAAALVSLVGALVVPPACAQTPNGDDEFAAVLLTLTQPAGPYPSASDWRALEALSGVRWEALPPRRVEKALADGKQYLRRGVASIGGRRFVVMATGELETVSNLYFRNLGPGLEESAAVAALRRQGYRLSLARCPVRPSSVAGSTWWRVEHPEKQPAYFRAQTRCNGRQCEDFALLLVQRLPALTRATQTLYTDRCREEGTVTGPREATGPREPAAAGAAEPAAAGSREPAPAGQRAVDAPLRQ